MHELSIALGIVDRATDEMQRHPGVFATAIHLRVGALSGVVKEALLFSWDVACQDTSLKGSSLIIEEVPVTIFCAECQKETVTDSIQLFACSTCGQFSSDVIKGRELEVVAIELEDLAEAAGV